MAQHLSKDDSYTWGCPLIRGPFSRVPFFFLRIIAFGGLHRGHRILGSYPPILKLEEYTCWPPPHIHPFIKRQHALRNLCACPAKPKLLAQCWCKAQSVFFAPCQSIPPCSTTVTGPGAQSSDTCSEARILIQYNRYIIRI